EEPSCGTALSDSARIGGTHPPLGCAGGACAWLHPEPLLVPLDFVVWARLRATWRDVQGDFTTLNAGQSQSELRSNHGQYGNYAQIECQALRRYKTFAFFCSHPSAELLTSYK